MTSKDEIKDRVLTENTAQGILTRLRELESNRARMQTRWIWELLQNARDASVDQDTQLLTSIEIKEDNLVFQHNGRGFTMEEVAHLIYHGSTKLEDGNTLGRYGSGFLTTHLLSPIIYVSGQLNDGQAFEFPLKREIGSAKALSDSMDEAWNEFDATVVRASDAPFTTRFRYPIEENSIGVVKEGINELKRCAPLVVAFNHQFRCINITSSEEVRIFEVSNRALLQEGLQMVTVQESCNGSVSERKYLLATGDRVSVVVPLESTNDGLVCSPLGGIPRLFLGFPLVGTETFSFPAVINSFEFTPTENRDGVFLGQSADTANQTNQAVFEEACELHSRLIEFAANAQWSNIHRLANIPPITEQVWFNRDWVAQQLQQLVSRIREIPAVLSEDGPIRPRASILPLAGEVVRVEALWDLLNKVNAFRQKLPRRTEASGWCNTVVSWAAITGHEATQLTEGYDGSELVSYLEKEKVSTLERLKDILHKSVDAVEWLDLLYQLLKDDGRRNTIQEYSIVLGQTGHLDKLSNLYRDNGIAEELKAISDDVLELGVRGRLRDTRLTSLADEIGKGERSNEEVVQEITNHFQKLRSENNLGTQFIKSSPRLLAWLVTNQHWIHIAGFPVYSIRPDDGKSVVILLGQRGSDSAEVPLAPIKAWAEDLQEYADLFPWQHILANEFFTAMPRHYDWQVLNEKGLVRTDVLVSKDKSLSDGDFLPEEPSSDVEHKTIDTVPVTDVVFLTGERGVMARVRDSQPRARLFWRFLTDWLATRDPEGLETKTTTCVCEANHLYFHAMWLVPVVRNSWVPQGNNIRTRATAQSLANLFKDSDWTPASLSDQSTTTKLLEAIHVTRFDLMRHFVVSDDQSRSALDDTMTSILVSTGGDLSNVRDFVDDMKTDDGLPQYLAERRERRRIVHENQRLGNHVENLVKEALKNQGFIVIRTGIGSDFEIEYDLVEENTEMGIELSRGDQRWLIEVKATREQRVRMTAKQAEAAVERGNGFLLCVVPVGPTGTSIEKDDVRANMRFVQNIGPRVEPLCVNLEKINTLRDDATTPSGNDVQLEIEAGTARIRVDNAVWQNGIRLEDLSSQLK